jgi:hypothetical protein
MNRKTRFAIVTIISFFSLLLVGVYDAHAQEKSDMDRRGTQTSVSVDPAPSRRGDVTTVPPPGGATQGPVDVHPESRPRQSSSSSFPGPISDVQSAIKVLPQGQANIKSKTPCGSPECQSQALATKKQSTAKMDVIKATSGQVTGSGFKGTARTGRR